ncbi:MAG: hypothetical protein ACK55Z_34375, partial [bacterium]
MRICCVLQGYVNIQGKVKVPVQDAQAGRVGSPPPPPTPLAEPGGGGGEEAGKSCPAWGILSGEGGDLWQVNLAGHVRGWIWRVSTAR